MRAIADPLRAMMTQQTAPVVITGGASVNLLKLGSIAKAASDQFDADHVHLVFEPGREAEGPKRILVGMHRDRIVHVKTDCSVWADPRRRPFLLARQVSEMGLTSFDPDGMDYRPGRPKTNVAKGLARGAELLRRLAANDLEEPVAAAG
ncbi:MAG: hypothetical protein KYX69_11740 [Sphingomonas sp.]|uniref:hypothetical protein n=1 Tax=Sphingomonas sp. TaxID=28214 RepID=UPI001EB443A3|nr:hypothetical protein [Sphingomonas sp.]MBX3595560.1 hypothetical protein [Sphingomonas sp.]MDK2768378.1 hypothetical protein [Sphingomonas sp.]